MAKKGKKTMSAQDGLEIVNPSGGSYKSFVPKRTRKYRSLNELSIWSDRDFVRYIKIKWNEQNKGDEWSFGEGAAIEEWRKIKDDLSDFIDLTKEVEKSFIDYFFKEWFENFFKVKRHFRFYQMREVQVLKSFSEQFSFNKEEEDKKVSSSDIFVFDPEIMKSLILLDEKRFLSEYGLVIYINWLIKYDNLDIKAAVKKADVIVRKLNDRTKDMIISSTTKFSPYEKKMAFHHIRVINKILGKISVDFGKESRYSFLI